MPQALKMTYFSLYFCTWEEKNGDNKNRVSLEREDEGTIWNKTVVGQTMVRTSRRLGRWVQIRSVSPDQASEHPTPGYWLQRASLSKLSTTINYVKLEESLGHSLIGKLHRILVQSYRNSCNDDILRNSFLLLTDETWCWWNCRHENPRIQKILGGRLFSLDVLVFAFVVKKLCSTVLFAFGLLSHGP